MIWAFFAINLIAFLVIVFAFSLQSDKEPLTDLLYSKGIWVLISPLILFVLNGLISANQKVALVFWRVKYGLPGCRAFSYYAGTDSRINLNRISEIHGGLPTLPNDQNNKWYAIYKSFKDDLIIDKSHQAFLLARDLCASSFLFLLLLPVPVIIFSENSLKYVYLILLLLQYLTLVVIARNYGARFVCNVLSQESIK